MKYYCMITLIIFPLLFVIQLVSGMVLHKGATTLDHLVQKSLRCKHHKQKYIRSLDEEIVPTGLRINKKLENDYIQGREGFSTTSISRFE